MVLKGGKSNPPIPQLIDKEAEQSEDELEEPEIEECVNRAIADSESVVIQVLMVFFK